jgi:hypothetical protein
MATGWTAGPEGGWLSATFALSSDSLGFHQDGEQGVWRWIELAHVSGLDQVGDDEGNPILEFVLFDGRVLVAKLEEAFLARVVDALQRSRERDGDTAADPTAPADELVVAPVPGSRAAEPPGEPDDAPSAVAELAPPPPPGRSGSKSALAREVKELREFIDGLGFTERAELRADVESLTEHRAEVRADVRVATAELRERRAELVRVRRDVILQGAGLYHYRHPLDDAASLADRLDEVRSKIEAKVVDGEAIAAADDWTVDGSRVEGRKMVDDLSKLLLRSYNQEAELLVRTLRPFEVDDAVDRLGVTRDTIGRLGRSMQISIVEDYHRLRVEELTLTGDHLARVDEALHAEGRSDGDRVYVASNPAFGRDVVRIGRTAADDRETVGKELDSPSLPFRFDVHTVLAPDDPDELMTSLRDALETRRLNLTDPGCEYFRSTPDVVRLLLETLGSPAPEFVVEPDSEEWQLSENARSDDL